MGAHTFAEYFLNVQVREYLAAVLPDAVCFHVPNEGKRGRYEALRLKRMGVTPGVADLVLIVDGRTFFIEIKTAKGRLSPAQVAFAEDARAAGAEFAVVRGLDDVRAALKGWGIATREAAHA